MLNKIGFFFFSQIQGFYSMFANELGYFYVVANMDWDHLIKYFSIIKKTFLKKEDNNYYKKTKTGI